MSVELVVANFLRIARGDLRDARHLGDAGSRNAVYLCEQAAEKIVKALLTSEGIHASRSISHQLDRMADLLPDANPFKERLRGIEILSAYATSYRYPTPAGRVPRPPSAGELRAVMNVAERLLADVAQAFGVDLDASDRVPAQTARPPRTPIAP